MTLTNSNTFTGSTTLVAGTLVLGKSDALQNSVLYYIGGSLSYGALNSLTLGGLNGGQPISLTNDGSAPIALTLGNNSSNCSYSGVLSGTGSLTKVGSSVQTLSGVNTFTGVTKVAGGTLSIGNAKALQYSMLDYDNYGGEIRFNGTTAATVAGLKGSQESESGNDFRLVHRRHVDRRRQQ